MLTEIYNPTLAHNPQFNVGQYQNFKVAPLTGALGAEVTGLCLNQCLDNETVAKELKQALSQHLVLMFREQQLERNQLRRFGQIFGPLQVNNVVKKQGEEGDVMVVKQEADEQYNFAGNWHSDVSWGENPSGVTALIAIEVPPCGGDTHFSNMALAYEALSPSLKSKINGLKAIHALERSQREFSTKKKLDSNMRDEEAVQFLAEHPVVRVDPVSRRPSLYVNEQFVSRFSNMTEEESLPLLEMLFRHQVRPDFTCRIRWEKNTLAVWNNRSTIHYASNDYPGFRREMLRVSTVGEKPVAIAE